MTSYIKYNPFVFSEQLKGIQCIQLNLKISNCLQPHNEVLTISQCKTREDVMNLEANLNDDIYQNSLVPYIGEYAL